MTTGEPGAWLKRDQRAKVTPPHFHRVKRGLDQSCMVRPATRAAAERRKASAPASGGFVQADRPWRAPRPQHSRMATSESVVRLLTTRLPALRLPSLWRPVSCRAVAKLGARTESHREKENLFFPLPAIAGRGRDASASEAIRVEGAFPLNSARCRLSASASTIRTLRQLMAPPHPDLLARQDEGAEGAAPTIAFFYPAKGQGMRLPVHAAAAKIAPAGTENSPQRARGRRRV